MLKIESLDRCLSTVIAPAVSVHTNTQLIVTSVEVDLLCEWRGYYVPRSAQHTTPITQFLHTVSRWRGPPRIAWWSYA